MIEAGDQVNILVTESDFGDDIPAGSSGIVIISDENPNKTWVYQVDISEVGLVWLKADDIEPLKDIL